MAPLASVSMLDGWPRGEWRSRTDLSIRRWRLGTLRAMERRGLLVRAPRDRAMGWRRPWVDRAMSTR